MTHTVQNEALSHTQGPWETSAGPSDDYPNEVEWQICEEGGGDQIATMWGDSAQANAQLIAAAPELLAALKAFIDAAGVEMDYNGGEVHVRDACALVNRIEQGVVS